jgi:hypothetical protein
VRASKHSGLRVRVEGGSLAERIAMAQELVGQRFRGITFTAIVSQQGAHHSVVDEMCAASASLGRIVQAEFAHTGRSPFIAIGKHSIFDATGACGDADAQRRWALRVGAGAGSASNRRAVEAGCRGMTGVCLGHRPSPATLVQRPRGSATRRWYH